MRKWLRGPGMIMRVLIWKVVLGLYNWKHIICTWLQECPKISKELVERRDIIWQHETVATFWVLSAFPLWLSWKKTWRVIVSALMAISFWVEWCRPRWIVGFQVLGAVLEVALVWVVGLNDGEVGISSLRIAVLRLSYQLMACDVIFYD